MSELLMQGKFSIVNSDAALEQYIAELRKEYAEHHYLRCQHLTGRQRTAVQNNALHLYCSMLAEALNDAGYDMRRVLKQGVEIPWNMESVKDHLWRPIQEAVTKKQSTKEPLTTEYGEIYEVLNRHLATKFGVSVQWPCKDGRKAA